MIDHPLFTFIQEFCGPSGGLLAPQERGMIRVDVACLHQDEPGWGTDTNIGLQTQSLS